MKISKISTKYIILFHLGIIMSFIFLVPFLLDIMVKPQDRIETITFLGDFFINFVIFITIFDLFLLIALKRNIVFLSFLNMSFCISLFLLMVYSFLNDIFDIHYVWYYSKSNQPVIYKLVAIWAGEAGSIMTWMIFNSMVIFFYRIRNHDSDDVIFLGSVIISLLISVVFLFILQGLDPFYVEEPSIYFPKGQGLNAALQSPWMIWHPLFVFISYAIFIIPFSKTIIEILLPNSKLKGFFQIAYNDFALKFGWFVLTLGIGFGAYWAKVATTSSWGRYWGWDPVETVSLLPWLFSTAFFHTMAFKKKKEILVKINIISIFLSNILATLISRGGGLTSIHQFTGGADLVIWVALIGLVLIISTLYIIYDILNFIIDNYKKTKVLFHYLSYFFLIMIAYICVLGLVLPPLTYLLPGRVLYIGPYYYIVVLSIPAIGLALTLIFCSLQNIFELKRIGAVIIIGFLIQLAISIILFLTINIWINPVIMIYILAMVATVLSLIKNFNIKKGLKIFLRTNSKTVIHIGTSFILIGTLLDPSILLDFFYITGFFILLIGIIPSIIVIFFKKRKIQLESSKEISKET